MAKLYRKAAHGLTFVGRRSQNKTIQRQKKQSLEKQNNISEFGSISKSQGFATVDFVVVVQIFYFQYNRKPFCHNKLFLLQRFYRKLQFIKTKMAATFGVHVGHSSACLAVQRVRINQNFL